MRLTVKTPILYLSIIDSLNPDPWEIFQPGRSGVVSFAAVFSVVTQCSSERCVTTLKTAAWETRSGVLVREIQTDQKRIIILFFRKSKIQKLLRMSSI